MTRAWLLALGLAVTSVRGAATYEINGVVVDSLSQKPLADARVTLAPSTARAQKLELVTKQDGRFSFAVSQAGKYTLQIAKPGYPVQSYRAAGFGGLSSAIVVRDDQDTGHIVFQANRGGVITGQIKDDDSEPVGNALVTVFQSLMVGGERKIVTRGQMRANAAGVFRFAGLLRGNYYVCAMGRPWFADSLIQMQEIRESMNRPPKRIIAPAQPAIPTEPDPDDDQPLAEPDTARAAQAYSPDPAFHGTAFVTTFYPRAQTIEEAGVVRLETGGEAQVIITLPLTKAVTIKGALDASGELSAGRANLLKKVYDQYLLFLQDVVPKEGTFQFKNAPAGSYEIVAASDSASGASSWTARQQVEVGTSDKEVTLRPQSMGGLSGHVLFEGEPAPATTSLFVTLRNDKGNSVRIQVDPAGNFSLTRLLPGQYEVAAGSGEYVASYFAGPAGQSLPLTVEIGSGGTIHRDLTLTKAVSVIEGVVAKSGTPQVGALVILMPKNPSERWAYRMDQTDSDGSYHLGTIPAGDYFLIALSDGADVAYRDAKVAATLAKAAKSVHIEAGDQLDMKLEVVDAPPL